MHIIHNNKGIYVLRLKSHCSSSSLHLNFNNLLSYFTTLVTGRNVIFTCEFASVRSFSVFIRLTFASCTILFASYKIWHYVTLITRKILLYLSHFLTSSSCHEGNIASILQVQIRNRDKILVVFPGGYTENHAHWVWNRPTGTTKNKYLK